MADSQLKEDQDRPVIELFVKAASDKVKNGPCPICHQYFMAFYILRERGMVDLIVTTFLPETPPREVLEFSTGKQSPLVKVHRGKDAKGEDMTELSCSTMDEIEVLLDRFMVKGMMSRQVDGAESAAEKIFEDLLTVFNKFIQSEKQDKSKLLLNKLEQLDAFLGEKGTKFLLSEHLKRADCYLLPRLQHIRVAGAVYADFEIPASFRNLWRYLANAYATDAFRESCPENAEIIKHYTKKTSRKANKQLVAELTRKGTCLDCPEEEVNANDANGDHTQDAE